ncbi:MAG: DUF89 family protein [Proteobacteria bacterium]|nr:DUF89 family protein [Pseudomonadota bacterium]
MTTSSANDIQAPTMFPECGTCLTGLARMAAELVAGEDSDLRTRAERAARDALDREACSGLTSPEVANRMLRAMARVTGVADPFEVYKRKEMALASTAVRSLGIDGTPDLSALLRLAVLGNSLDFFRPPPEAFAELERFYRGGLRFHRDDSARLAETLATRPELVIYLTDNAGEVLFDLPLYDHIRARAQRTVLGVKGGPALNDLTRADLEQAGLAGRFAEIVDTGTDGAGLDWSRLSDEFTALLDRADLVVSKGMANFETLYPRPLPGPVFFVFKVKCRPIQDWLKAPAESYWALWRDGRPVR